MRTALLRPRNALVVVGLAVGLLGAGLVAADVSSTAPPSGGALPGGGAVSSTASRKGLERGIVGVQAQLRRVPSDWSAWAALGFAYVQQGRITADPTFYPKAEGALQRSLELDSASNDKAMAGMGALSSARHDFTGALQWAERAERINSYSSSTYGVKADALTELGRYPEAFAAVQQMVDLGPGISSFARASYTFELRGDLTNARTALERALQTASTPSDRAFALHYLGELAWNAGDVQTAGERYSAALQADPSSVLSLVGTARVAAARGDSETALRDYRRLTEARPEVLFVNEFGEYLASLGRDREAAEQFGVVGVTSRLFAANGVNVDLELSLFEADHGDPAAALRSAEAEWGRRQSITTADAYAWALHVNGRDEQALSIARQALQLNTPNASFTYHLGMIEKALGQTDAARAHLQRALEINPNFSWWGAPRAKAALAELAAAG